MSSPIRIAQVGLGPLGQMLTPYLMERSGIEIVGAVDIDPAKSGCDLGDVSTCGQALGIAITDDLDKGLAGADLAVVTTVSELRYLAPTLKKIVGQNVHVVSTCEELAYPWMTHPELSATIDSWAKARGVSVLGTGINPGFLMDFLPTAATGVCHTVEGIRVERIQDASARRLPFQKKIGVGLTVEEFQSLVRKRKIRHVGLTESMHMIASRLGWALDRTEDIVEPVVSEDGRCAGVVQTGRGYQSGREVLTLVFKAAVGRAVYNGDSSATGPRERIRITGTPAFDLIIPGGINGDIATCAVIANAIPIVASAAPGLHTMIDLPPLSCAQAVYNSDSSSRGIDAAHRLSK